MFVCIDGKQGKRIFYVGLHVHDIVYIENRRIDIHIGMYIQWCTVYVHAVGYIVDCAYVRVGLIYC